MVWGWDADTASDIHYANLYFIDNEGTPLLQSRSGTLIANSHTVSDGGNTFTVDDRDFEPDVAYGIEYRGAPIRQGLTAREGTEQPAYYWDPVHRAQRHVVLHGRPVPGLEGHSSSEASSPQTSCASTSRVTGS